MKMFNHGDSKYKVHVRKNSIINFDEDLKEYECRVGGVQLIGEIKDSFVNNQFSINQLVTIRYIGQVIDHVEQQKIL